MAKQNDTPSNTASYFDGTTIQLIGWRILCILLTGITLGLAYPWANCMLTRWEINHTVINGRRLRFTGRGHQFFGRYLLWLLLTVVTFGIYGFWFGLGVTKWKVKHTVYEDDESGIESRFTGSVGGWLGQHLLSALIIVVTLGLGKAAAERRILSWKAEHTEIGGSPLVFSGTGGQLFVKYLLLWILTPLTLGIYALLFPVKLLRWKYSCTEASCRSPLPKQSDETGVNDDLNPAVNSGIDPEYAKQFLSGKAKAVLSGIALIVVAAVILTCISFVRPGTDTGESTMVPELFGSQEYTAPDVAVTPSAPADSAPTDVLTGDTEEYPDDTVMDDFPAMNEMAAQLCGKWRREQLSISPMETEIQGLITIQDYTFNLDGTFVYKFSEYETESSASYWHCTHDESHHGTYTFEGDTLQFISEDEHNVVWIPKCEITDDGLIITGSVYGLQNVEVYHRTEEEADLTDCMTIVSEYNSRITGLWDAVWREGEFICMDGYQFNSDGTFYWDNAEYMYMVYTDFPEISGWDQVLGTSSDGIYIFDGEHLILRHAEDLGYELSVYVQTIDVKIYDGYAVFDGRSYLAADSEALEYDETMDLEELERRGKHLFESRCEAHSVDRSPP